MFVNILLAFVPISVTLAYAFHAPAAWIFVTGILGIVPVAEYIRKATEHIAARAGTAVGGLLNVTFGNVSELVIALFVLAAGNANVVKGQITDCWGWAWGLSRGESEGKSRPSDVTGPAFSRVSCCYP